MSVYREHPDTGDANSTQLYKTAIKYFKILASCDIIISGDEDADQEI